MARRFFFILIIFSLLIPAGALAQQAIEFAAIQVELWPEYDHPEMLVIYRSVLSTQVSLPVDVTFRIPAVVGEPSAVAVRQMDGTLFNAVYDRRVEGEWALITITATMPEIQLEYYDPQLTMQDANRHYEYHWPGDYTVEDFAITVQQPVGASSMSIEPDLGEFVAGSDGLTYYNFGVGSLVAGQDVSMIVDYVKETDALSVESLQVQASVPISDDTQGRVDLLDLLPWVLGVIGVFLMVGGVWWYWQSGREESAAAPRRARRSARTSASRASDGEIEGVYCHQCGKRGHSGDRFCRSCGSKMRTE